MTNPSVDDGSGYPVWSVFSLKIPLYNIPDVDEIFIDRSSLTTVCKTLKQLSTRLSLVAYCNEIPRISPQACPKRLITVFSAIMCTTPPDLTDLAIVRIISAHCSVSIWLPGTCIRLLSFLILYNNDNNSNNLVQDIILWSYSLNKFKSWFKKNISHFPYFFSNQFQHQCISHHSY